MIAPISAAAHALGTSIGGIGSVGSVGAANAASATGATTAASGSFGSQLASAVGSLESTQNTASQAAQGLATGTITDPTQAVTAVESASLAMDVASQIQNKLVSAETTIFQTQV